MQLEGGQAHTGDLLVGADGPGSLVRSHFCPRVRSQYAGYVAWRGVAPEGEVPARVLGFLGTKFTVYQVNAVLSPVAARVMHAARTAKISSKQ